MSITFKGYRGSWIITLVVSALILSFACDAFAQKKKKKKNQEVTITVKRSKEEKALVESHFIEGQKFFLLGNYEKSTEQFEKVIKLDPNNSAAHYKLAQIFTESEDDVKALSHAVKAKNLDRKNKYYYIILANIYTNLADLEMAAATYSELITNVKGTENYLFELAALQLYQKKYEEALSSYNRAQEFFGPIDEIIFQKQKIYLKQNKLDLVVIEGEELINNNPGQSRYVASLAQILISNNQPEKAQVYLEKYVENYGDEPTIGVQLAEIYRKAGKIKEAILVLKTAFKSTNMDVTAKVSTLSGYMAMLPNEDLIEPLIGLTEGLKEAHPDSFQGYAVTGDLYFNTGKKRLAKDNYLKAVEINSSNYNVWQNIISIEMDLQEYKSAIEHTEQALEYFPNQAALYYFGGTANLIEKNYQEAIELLKMGKTYTASNKNLNSVINGQLGDAYNGIGDHENSDLAYEDALKQNPDNDHVLNNYSYFLSLRNLNMEKAEKMSTRLISLRGDNPTYLDTHGWVLYTRKKYKDALIYLQRAAEKEDNPTIIEHYGDVLFQLGKVDRAVEQWKRAQGLSDDNENLNKKIADRKLYE